MAFRILVGHSRPFRPASRSDGKIFPSPAALKVSEYIFHQDHRGIHDNAEINRAYGKQLATFPESQEESRLKKTQRNVQSDNDCAPQIAEENPLNQKNEHDAEYQIMQHGSVVTSNQPSPVVKGNDFHAGGRLPSRFILSIAARDLSEACRVAFRSRFITTIPATPSAS